MARTYVVKAGDTLRKIAKEVLGDTELWSDIYAANKDKIKNPDVIQAGQELTLPTPKEDPKRPDRSGPQRD